MILDVSTPAAPVLVGSCDTPGPAYGIDVEGALAYVAVGDFGLQIIDVSTPSAPVVVSSLDGFNARDVEVAGSLSYVTTLGNGLQIIDVSAPVAPVLLGSYVPEGGSSATYHSVQDIEVVGPVAYVSCGSAGLHILDVSDPQAPVLLYVYDTLEPALGIEVVDSIVYVAYRYDGLLVLQFGAPELDLAPASDTGPRDDDNVTEALTLEFSVPNMEPGDYIRLYQDGVLRSAEYTTSPVTVTADGYGSFLFTIEVVDAAGNVSPMSDPVRVTIYRDLGDADFDRKVDGTDLAIWQQHYDPLGVNENTFEMGDWNSDGRIDGGDLALWQQEYNPLGV